MDRSPDLAQHMGREGLLVENSWDSLCPQWQ